MSFGGSVLAMIVTLKNNARPRRKAFQYGDEKNRFIRAHLELKYRTVSVERLARIKKKIRKESDKEDRRSLLRTMAFFGLISILLVGALSYYYFQMKEKNAAIYSQQKLRQELARQDAIALRQNNVDYFLINGKHYLESGDYNYAKILYSKAYQLNDESHEALKGCAASYIHDCHFNNRGCQDAKQLLKIYYNTYGETDSYKKLAEMLSI